jgi:hypothetical protein
MTDPFEDASATANVIWAREFFPWLLTMPISALREQFPKPTLFFQLTGNILQKNDFLKVPPP